MSATSGRWQRSTRADSQTDSVRCPHCGGLCPLDDPTLDQACLCGIKWGLTAPFPRPELTGAEWDTVRSLLLIRCGGRCEVSGVALRAGRWSVSHRRPRGMGGTDRPDVHSLANLLAVTGDGVSGVHGWIESHREQARALGWLLGQDTDPAAEPVVLYSGRRVALDPRSPLYLPVPDGPVYAALDLPSFGAA